MSDKRQIIVCDVETTGLNVNACWPLEVAAINIDTDEQLEFVPFVTNTALGYAEKQAMQVNRYYERGVWERMLSAEETTAKWDQLRDMLTGNTLAGSNPRFDADVIARFTGAVWHHRLADVSNYAAPALGLGPDDLPGLARVCEALKVVNQGEHSAIGDALATAECFKILAASAAERRAKVGCRNV